ncbi:MAG: hypothetical protein ABI405_11465 [Parafilimonas sp.]
MKYFIKTGRIFYAIALIVYGIQQFIYGDFRNVLLPPWQSHLPLLPAWAYLFGLYLIASGIAIIIGKKVYEVSLILGGILLFIVCAFQIPYELISEPNKSYHMGLWTSVLKEAALAGGAFVVADSLMQTKEIAIQKNKTWIKILDKIKPYGNIFFCNTMICFGIAHFMYGENISNLVPSFFPDHIFWTYFAAVALIGSGSFIILNIRTRVIALLLSLMIFLWFWMVHLPGAFQDPHLDRGNNVSSAFDALAFSGIALLIAFTLKKQKLIDDIEKIGA